MAASSTSTTTTPLSPSRRRTLASSTSRDRSPASSAESPSGAAPAPGTARSRLLSLSRSSSQGSAHSHSSPATATTTTSPVKAPPVRPPFRFGKVGGASEGTGLVPVGKGRTRATSTTTGAGRTSPTPSPRKRTISTATITPANSASGSIPVPTVRQASPVKANRRVVSKDRPGPPPTTISGPGPSTSTSYSDLSSTTSPSSSHRMSTPLEADENLASSPPSSHLGTPLITRSIDPPSPKSTPNTSFGMPEAGGASPASAFGGLSSPASSTREATRGTLEAFRFPPSASNSANSSPLLSRSSPQVSAASTSFPSTSASSSPVAARQGSSLKASVQAPPPDSTPSSPGLGSSVGSSTTASPGRRKKDPPTPLSVSASKAATTTTLDAMSEGSAASAQRMDSDAEVTVSIDEAPSSTDLPVTPTNQAYLSSPAQVSTTTTDGGNGNDGDFGWERTRMPSFGEALSSAPTTSKPLRSTTLSRDPSDDSLPLSSSTGSGPLTPPSQIRRPPYAGLGLGLPFSVSEASGLHGLALPSSPPVPVASAGDSFGSPQSPPVGTKSDRDRKPSATSTTDGSESPGSPVMVDRTRLVGLGELATPRWAGKSVGGRIGIEEGQRIRSSVGAGMIQRDWSGIVGDGSPTKDHRVLEQGEGWENDVLGSYAIGEGDSSKGRAGGHSHGRSLSVQVPAPKADSLPTLDPDALRHRASVSAISSAAPQAPSIAATLEPIEGSPARKRKASPSAALGRDDEVPPTTPQLGSEYRHGVSRSNSSRRNSRSDLLGKNVPPSPAIREDSAQASPASANWSSVSKLPSIPSGGLQLSPGFLPSESFDLSTVSNSASEAQVKAAVEKSTRSQHHRTPSSSTRASRRSTPQTVQPSLEQPRVPHAHSHHHSPSTIAHSILKSATEKSHQQGEDIGTVAAHDGGTAEALRKLDGLNAVSPRLSRHSLKDGSGRPGSSGRPSSSGVKRTTPGNSRPGTPGSAGLPRPPLKDRTKSDDAASISSKKLRSRSIVSMKDAQPDASEDDTMQLSKLRHPALSSASSISFPTSTATGSPRAAFPPAGSRRASQARLEHSSSDDWKRGSSSSTAGTSTAESRESTSATSLSGSSAPNRSPNHKRRSSASSEVSSVHSGDGHKVDLDHDGAPIPPVPPLPKDYEAYGRRASSGISPLVTIGSPRESQSSDRTRLLNPFRSSTVDEPSPAIKPTKKWSLTAALGIHRSPSFSHEASPASSSEEVSRQLSSGKKLKSSTDLANSSGDSRRLRHQVGGYPSGDLSASERGRTMSTSTVDTDTTAGTPTVVTSPSTKPRNNVLSPRRTPSGIPFFSRTSTSTTIAGDAPSTPSSKTSDGAGRKSILGLNVFTRSNSSKKPSVPSLSASMTSSASRSNLRASTGPPVDGGDGARKPESSIPVHRRNSITTKASSLMGRKRGKTLSSAESPKEEVPPPLPPIQMPAIPPTTVQRVQNLSGEAVPRRSSELNSNSVSRGSRIRTIKESTTRRTLPTITGSPARGSPRTELPQDIEENAQAEAPTSITPTKIPRAVFRAERRSPSLRTKRSDASMDVDKRAPSNGADVSELGLLGSSKRNPDLSGSLIPRTRSVASSGTARSIRRPSKSELKADDSTVPTRRRSVVPEEASEQAPAASSLKTPIKTSAEAYESAAARLAAARRTVAKTQEAQAARDAARRLSAATQPTVTEPLGDVSATSSMLTTSRSTRTLSNKLALPSRISRSSTQPTLAELRPSSASDSVRSPSASTTSTRGTPISEEELRGDEEMMVYVQRQTKKKIAAGMTESEVSKLFEFPEMIGPATAMSPQEALRHYRHYLSDYERGEILDYTEIFHVGAESAKKAATREASANNFGYDDERGDYLIVTGDHLRFRYEIIDVLGKGSFGQVLQCRDHKTGEMVAVKIIRNRKRFHHQALVEIKVLENLVKWDPDDKHCVLKLTDHFSFRGHLCIVNELLSINLYELIRNNGFHGFSTVLIRRFTIQILQSLSLLRHHRVVHCDLKPENILLKHPCKSGIKTIDFGSSCFEHEKVYTYIQSRFYRSPEVILGMNYHMAIDMWSLGCILAELHTGYPIFPGETENEQLACIMEVLGLPDKYLVDRSSRRKVFFDSTGAPRPVSNSKGRRRRVGTKSLQAVLKTDDELFVDFIAKCLAWDPERRLKPDPAMRHPWITANRRQAGLPFGAQNSSSSNLPSRLSARTSIANGAGISSSIISSPRRKQPTASSLLASTGSLASSGSTPVAVSTLTTNGASSAARVRTQSTASRLHPKGQYGLHGSIRQSLPARAQ